MRKLNVIASVLIILGITATAFGQDKGNENSADRALRGGGRVNASTLGMEFELPLGSYPGRGINIPINLSYSSKLWRADYITHSPIPGGNFGGCHSVNEVKFSENSASGWTTSLATPYIEYTGYRNIYLVGGEGPNNADQCDSEPGVAAYTYIRRITVHLPSGETHELRPDDTVIMYPSLSNCVDNDPETPCYPSDPSNPGNWDLTYYAVDGSNIKYLQNSATNTYRLLMPDGSYYDFDSAAYNGADRKAVRYTDRNGNYTTFHAPDSTYPNGRWTDTLGRTLSVPIGVSAPASATTAENPQIYSMPGMTGSYKFHWKKLKGNTASESALTDFTQNLRYYGNRYSCGQGTSSTWCLNTNEETYLFGNEVDIVFQNELFNPILLTEIELPTGQKYKFTYDVYGRIERIYYPTGGEERFQYAFVPPLGSLEPGSIGMQTNFGVVSRKVYETAGQGNPYEWTYNAGQVSNGYRVTIINPDNTVIQRFMHRGDGGGLYGYDESLSGMSYREELYDNASPRRLVSRKLTHWTKTVLGNVGADWHPRVTSEESQIFDINQNGISATTVFEYEGDLTNRETPVLTKKSSQYAFVAVGGDLPTMPLRMSETTFLINDESLPQWARNIYKAQNMIGLVTSSVIRDGSGTIVSRSETRYDEAPYSPNIGRGNPTALRVWDNSKGNWENPNAYLATRAKFDTFGNQYEAIDARGNSTFTEFDAVHHAFPVRVVFAVPDPSGTNGSSTAFETTAAFDWITGLLLRSTDANGLETRITYDPVTLRPLNTKTFFQNTQVGGMNETVYHDEPHNFWVKSRSQIDTDKWAENIAYFDGLGRAYKAEEINSEGNVLIEKEFDDQGRVKRATNPFRTGEIKHWTTNVYDESSRIKEVILPDGARVKTDYGVLISDIVGVTKTITDQAGKKRRGISDALGRMVRVIEDPDGQNLPTDYVFDTLSNLLKITQGVQNRYFTYDTLGRLLYAKQPEQDANTAFIYTDPITNNSQWSVKYEYDANGNITRTTDANGTSVQGTYDNLNRLKIRDYSDSTPDVQFYYDGKGLDSTPPFSKGKTTKVASSVSETQYTNFDALGRLLANRQITAGQAYNFDYQYNLTSLIAETYPSGRTVSYEFDQDGDLSRIAGRTAGGSKTYANAFKYSSSGAVQSMRLGNGRWETARYNERLQITQIGLGSSAADAGLLNLEYGYGNNQQNNGSLRTQKISFNGLVQPFEQVYSYDDLNRLLSAEEKVGGSMTWKQTFTYDRYGNRRFDANQTTTPAQSNNLTNPQIDPATNRFTSGQNYLYDQNGSLTRDAEGRHFLYDAESHQREVRNTNDQIVARYLYDGEGRRVKKVLPNSQEETIFVYNAGGKLAAEYVINPQTQAETPSTRYLTNDHLGSPRVITDQFGKVINRKDFMAFGEETYSANRSINHGYASTSDDNLRQGYTGYEKDDESGLDFAQARYYNSQHGRFTSVDPLTGSANLKNPQTFNRYSYVLNSPYKFTDPLGLISRSVSCCSAEEIDAQIKEDVGTGTVDGQVYQLDEKSIKKLVKLLRPFYTQAALSGVKAQRQINRATQNSPKTAKIITLVTTPGAVTQKTTTTSTSIGGGGKVREGVDIKESLNLSGEGAGDLETNGAIEKEVNGKIDETTTTVTTKTEPTTVTTTESIPDNSMNLALENLNKEEDNLVDLGQSAANSINGQPVSGNFLDSNTNTQFEFNKTITVKINGFKFTPKLRVMFEAGRKSVTPDQ